MSLKLNDIIGNIFYTHKKEEAEQKAKSADLQKKATAVFGTSQNTTNNVFNPFLNKNGEVFNNLINYQKVLNNPNVSQKAKNFITQATGLTQTVPSQPTAQTSNTATPKRFVSPEQSVGATNNSIVNAANKYIGIPYVWGGESMSEGGMDCSGFVYNALNDAGYKVGRTNAQGYRSYGKSVDKSDMQAGDLLFFGTPEKATHIGIYLGNGKMIHSSGDDSNTKNNPGKGVSIINVDYRNDFLEAKRI